MSSRAEKRRQARAEVKGEWVGFSQDDQQTLNIRERVRTHMKTCSRCTSGKVASKGCPWLTQLFNNNPEFLRAVLNMEED